MHLLSQHCVCSGVSAADLDFVSLLGAQRRKIPWKGTASTRQQPALGRTHGGWKKRGEGTGYKEIDKKEKNWVIKLCWKLQKNRRYDRELFKKMKYAIYSTWLWYLYEVILPRVGFSTWLDTRSHCRQRKEIIFREQSYSPKSRFLK